MTSVLVLYYSPHGHIEKMAQAEAEDARADGANAVIKRVPELVPDDRAKQSGNKLDQRAPIAVFRQPQPQLLPLAMVSGARSILGAPLLTAAITR